MKRLLLLVVAAVLVPMGTAGAAVDHCPDHKTADKVEGQNNDYVPPAGTLFCVKGSTGNTGELIANGRTTLFEYLADAVDNGGGNDPDVSYYVIYGQVSTTTTSTRPPVTTITGPIELEVIEIPATTTTTMPIFVVPLPARTEVVYPDGEKATACVTDDGYPYLTSYPECPAATTTAEIPAPLAELPKTGAQSVLVWVGLSSLIIGLLARRLGR